MKALAMIRAFSTFIFINYNDLVMRKLKKKLVLGVTIFATVSLMSIDSKINATEVVPPGTCCYEHSSFCIPGIPNVYFPNHFWTTDPGPCN